MDFRAHLAKVALKASRIDVADAYESLSNWSYLHLSFQEDPPTQQRLELLIYAELTGKKRKHILQRLYTRWQKVIQQMHYQEMGI